MIPKTVACKRCGALNQPEFGACIRCGQSLRDADPAAGRRRVPARRVRRATLGGGAEILFGKFPAEQLPAAKLLLLLNLLVFVAQTMGAMQRGGGLGAAFTGGGSILEPFLYGAMPLVHPNWTLSPLALLLQEPWRLLSACFVHFGVIHLGMNMLGLIHLARVGEPLVGSVRFAIAYVVSGVAGFAVSFGWTVFVGPAGMITAGASGAIFGLLGLLLGVSLRRGDPVWKRRMVEAVIFSLAFGFIVPFINNAAHIGGLLAGTACGMAFAEGAPQPSRRWQRGLAALAMIACVGSIVAPRLSPFYEPALEQIAQERLERAYD